jgi:hypothetical protein
MVLVALNVETAELSPCDDDGADELESCRPDPRLESRSSSEMTGGEANEPSTGTVVLVDGSPLSSPPDVVPDPDVVAFSAPESVDGVVVPATEEPPGRVADGSEPTVDTGPEPAVVELD